MCIREHLFGGLFYRKATASVSASDIGDFLLHTAMMNYTVQTFPVHPCGRITYSHFIEDRLSHMTSFDL